MMKLALFYPLRADDFLHFLSGYVRLMTNAKPMTQRAERCV